MDNIQVYINKLFELNIITKDSFENTLWSIFIIIIWFIVSISIHKIILFIFKKFKIVDIIDRITLDYSLDNDKKEISKSKTIFKNNQTKKNDTIVDNEILSNRKKLSQKIKIDEIVAKAISYYVFLLFFRWALSKFWISEVEIFLKELIDYLPNLFVAFIIWFFWIRFANFIYDVTFHALDLGKQKTAKIIASWWKIIILFFTLMVVLWKIWIGTNITDIILIWFISMLSIAWWLAFWLWWKDVAREILESFRK